MKPKEVGWKAQGVFVTDTPETMGGKFCIRDIGGDGSVIAVTWDNETRQKIVRAVNSHEALVASLKTLCPLTKP